jgi:hypothetical protein
VGVECMGDLFQEKDLSGQRDYPTGIEVFLEPKRNT